MSKQNGSFLAAAVALGKSLTSNVKQGETVRGDTMQFVAIAWLARMTKKEINSQGRESSGVTEEVWASNKQVFSKCWRSLNDAPGKYGFGDWLALQWSRRDFSVSLNTAYDKSGGPRKDTDKVASLSKSLSALTSEEMQDVIARVVEIHYTQALAHNDIQANVKLFKAELVAAA